MRVLRNISELKTLPGPVALAAGVFDGVHPGHQEVIRAALEHTRLHGGTAVVMTFDPHPARVLRPAQAPKLLCSTAHKLDIIRRLGVGSVLVFPFDVAFSRIEARDFVKSLAGSCRPLGFVSVGHSWRFGHGGRGDIHLLMDLGAELGFCVHGVPPVRVGGQVVSSTLIREAVGAGDLQRAGLLLGRPYTVMGTVVQGRRLGRTIGFPTANLDVHSEQLPPAGVYVMEALLADGARCRGVANLGHRPTVATDDNGLSLELHLFDFDRDIYGQEVEVEFLHHIREEKKFPGLDALREQIAKDAAFARAFQDGGGLR
jgi:riboflavin kinase/FMN adenylyltransferase